MTTSHSLLLVLIPNVAANVAAFGACLRSAVVVCLRLQPALGLVLCRSASAHAYAVVDVLVRASTSAQRAARSSRARCRMSMSECDMMCVCLQKGERVRERRWRGMLCGKS
eukprot:6211932-Pleurochrysis_carterae.AAC.2